MTEVVENEMKYLIYKVGTEYYGSPLLSVREVLEYQKPKSMPNMVDYFSGVINVRGAVVGVIDLRSKLKCKNHIDRKTSMLLCDTQNGPIAAVVDGVESVLELTSKDVETEPPVKMRVPSEFLMGVAKSNQKLIILIDLLKSLTEDEYKAA